MSAHTKGVSLVYPDMVEGVDFVLVDLSDGRGAVLCRPNTAIEIEGIDLEAISAASVKFFAEDEASAYAMRRAGAYPPVTDYLDAQVKKSSSDPVVRAAGEKQEADYFATCLALKARYPRIA